MKPVDGMLPVTIYLQHCFIYFTLFHCYFNFIVYISSFYVSLIVLILTCSPSYFKMY